MGQEQVDDLLVEWELARQQGRELEAADLCQACPDLEPLVSEGIDILRRTSWMLKDPAAGPFEDEVLRSVSRIEELVTGRDDTQFMASDRTTPSQASEPDASGPGLELTTDASSAKPAVKKPTSLEPGPTQRVPEELTPKGLSGAADTSLDDIDIEGFELLEEIGRGGFGIVYRALDKQLQRQVAIKVPRLNSPDQREKYLREARQAAKVEASGIVPVLQVGTTPKGLPFVVQKFVQGKSLSEILDQGGHLSPTQTAALLVDVCKAVGKAHTRGLVHRDLKPANILIDTAGKPWVTDFGLAITEEDQLEKRGEIAGTLSYMSPEQMLGKVDWFDGRTDLWALGVILYQSLTGKLPFRASTRGELRKQILEREPRPISQRMPWLSKQWDVVFRQCCAKSVKERYDNAFELANDLVELCASIGPASESNANPVLEDLRKSDDTFPDPASIDSHLRSASSQRPASSTIISAAGSTPAWVWPALVGATFVLLLTIAVIWYRPFANPGTSTLATGPSESNGLTAKTTPNTAAPAGSGDRAALNADRRTAENLPIVVSPQPLPAESAVWQFTSIQAAIEAADENQEVVVRPGVYRESLSIYKPIFLRAEERTANSPTGETSNNSQESASETPRDGFHGEPSRVTILWRDQPAFVVARGAELSLDGFEIVPENEAAEVNAIEVRAGTLELQDCTITAAGYDCVKLDPSSRLLADTSTFLSRFEPAITAKRAAELQLRKCDFQLVSGEVEQPSTDTDQRDKTNRVAGSSSSGSQLESDAVTEQQSNLVGIQAIQTPGSVTECSFHGPTATAIEWAETDEVVRIEDCQFTNLEAGVLAFRCASIVIGGSLGEAGFENCRKSIELNGCNGAIRNCDLYLDSDYGRSAGSVGIQVHDRSIVGAASDAPTLEIEYCSVDGFESAIIVSQARAALNNLELFNTSAYGLSVINGASVEVTGPSIIRNGLGVGVLIEGGQANLERCEIKECSIAGVVVDGADDALQAAGCILSLNGVGIVLLSGTARLNNVELSGSTTGIVASRKSRLYPAPRNDAPLQLIVRGGSISSPRRAIHFLSPGSYRLEDCPLDDPHGEPVIDAQLIKVDKEDFVEVQSAR